MNWKLCVSDPQKNALAHCRGSMDVGDGYGDGNCWALSSGAIGFGNGRGNGRGSGYGDASAHGWGYGYGCGYGWGDGDGSSPAEWK